MRGLLGIAVLLLLAWAISEDRFRVAWRVVVTGVLLQFALALLFLKFPPATAVFLVLNQAVEQGNLSVSFPHQHVTELVCDSEGAE